MSVEPPADVFPPVVKPLLLEALGKSFLAYVLGTTEEEIERWLVSESDEFGSPQQNHALQQLHIVLHAQGGHDPALRQLNLSRILGIYQEPPKTTLVNVLRMIATNEVLAQVEQGTAEDVLAVLVRDVYPLYLLPEDTDWSLPRTAGSVYSHPVRERFESLIMAEGVFAELFSEEEQHLGRSGYLLRSTQHGSGVQLSMLADTLIASGWRAARMNTAVQPTLAEHIEATLAQLNILRQALNGKPVKVQVRVAFTGVLLTSDEPLDLGWGVLRSADERDRHLVPRSIEGSSRALVPMV